MEGNMPVVIVEMWEGRTIEQKKQLSEDITASMVRIGVPKEAVQIIIKDNPKHNWAIGGKLASE
jgi:4-oxalocrotonate tautomerase